MALQTCFEGPFGEVIRATGPMAKSNPFRFSTKYQDDETDLLYYGYRYYNPSTGRWISRDLIGEPGFTMSLDKKLSGRVPLPASSLMLWNDCLNKYDLLGLEECDVSVTFLNCGKALTSSDTQHILSRLCQAKKRLDGIIDGTKPVPPNLHLTTEMAKCLRGKLLGGVTLPCLSSCNPICWKFDAIGLPGSAVTAICAAKIMKEVSGPQDYIAATVIHELVHTCGKLGHSGTDDPDIWEAIIFDQ